MGSVLASSWPLRSEWPCSICWALWARVILAPWAWLSPVSRWCHEFLMVVKRAWRLVPTCVCACFRGCLEQERPHREQVRAVVDRGVLLPLCWVGQRELSQHLCGFPLRQTEGSRQLKRQLPCGTLIFKDMVLSMPPCDSIL